LPVSILYVDTKAKKTDDGTDYLSIAPDLTFRSRSRYQDDLTGEWISETEVIESAAELVELYNPADLYAWFSEAAREAAGLGAEPTAESDVLEAAGIGGDEAISLGDPYAEAADSWAAGQTPPLELTDDESAARLTVTGGVTPLIEITGGFVDDLTVRDNVYLTAGLHGMTSAQIDAKFDEIIEFADIGDFLDTPYKHLSSGMKVRIAFAVISQLEEPIMLVDEVLAVGDKAFREKCYRRIDELLAGGRTLFFVSHNERDLDKRPSQWQKHDFHRQRRLARP